MWYYSQSWEARELYHSTAEWSLIKHGTSNTEWKNSFMFQLWWWGLFCKPTHDLKLQRNILNNSCTLKAEYTLSCLLFLCFFPLPPSMLVIQLEWILVLNLILAWIVKTSLLLDKSCDWSDYFQWMKDTLLLASYAASVFSKMLVSWY